MNTLRAAILSEKFSHARQGTGIFRNRVFIYHLIGNSPQDVIMVSSGDVAETKELLRELRSTEPLAPTEGR